MTVAARDFHRVEVQLASQLSFDPDDSLEERRRVAELRARHGYDPSEFVDRRPVTRFNGGRPRARLVNYLRDLHEAYQDATVQSEPMASSRCCKCGRTRFSNVVKIRRRGVHAHYDGVIRCGLVWECPDCSAMVKAGRAEEIEAVKGWHTGRYGADAALLVTLTVRHGVGDDIRALRRAVPRCWQKVIQGNGWKQAKEHWGIVGLVRALEITHGEHGWHPHLHVLLLMSRPAADGYKVDRKLGVKTPAIVGLREWFYRRWRAAVAHELGQDNMPDAKHGVVITSCRDARYLSRMGLEISAPNTKAAKNGNRTPLDILASFVATGDLEDAELYRHYAAGMKGARQLTWSHGLKAAAGVDERTDEEIVAGTDETEPEICRIAGPDFDRVREIPGALTSLLELAELYGAPAVDAYVKGAIAELDSDTQRRSSADAGGEW